MKQIYICSAYRGETRKNIRNAKKYSKWVYKLGYLPICVHIYLEEATGMNEKTGDREKLLELGREFVKKCDEVWIFGEITEGMKREIETAKELGIKVKVVSEFKNKCLLYDYEGNSEEIKK